MRDGMFIDSTRAFDIAAFSVNFRFEVSSSPSSDVRNGCSSVFKSS